MKGRPTLYKGIRMRSRLEADYAGSLDRTGHKWEYEPECFADERGQWLADFRVDETNRPDGGMHLIELKPTQMLAPRKGEDAGDVLGRVDGLLARMLPAQRCEPDSSTDLVFWRYGERAPDLTIIGSRERPWVVHLPGFSIPFVWGGMRQVELLGIFKETIVEHADRLAEEAASAR
jgi:hypothetical protein